MSEGYIRLHRQIVDCPVFRNERMLKIWIWCLIKATHSERNSMVGLQMVNLKPGQFIFGRLIAAEQLEMPASTVWRNMKTLEAEGMLKIESNNKFSVVTIENWAFYQTDESNKPKKRKTSSKSTDTDKNVKNDKYIVPPTIEMVEQYCLEQKLPINPQKFMDYYESNGWRVGKSKMKDWQATVRSWARRESEYNPQPAVQEVKKYNI